MVAMWATYEGTQTGQMGPFPPSNRYAKFNFGGILRVENGKIAEWWVTCDNMSILSQLGNLPTEPWPRRWTVLIIGLARKATPVQAPPPDLPSLRGRADRFGMKQWLHFRDRPESAGQRADDVHSGMQ
jgi:hypothetical protein